MKDILDREIKIGDIVVHGQRSGNSGALYVKIVTDTRKVNRSWGQDELKVCGYEYITQEYNRDLRKWQTTIPYYRLSKGGWTFPERIIVITESVSEELRDILRSLVK